MIFLMMNKRSVFISRQIEADSPFNRVRENEIEIISKSLLQFSTVPFLEFPSADWYFFYSKKGVYYFFEQLSKKEKKIVASKKIGAFGKATSEKIKTYLKQPLDFIGTGNASIDNPQFQSLIDQSSVCFVRANHSRRSMQQNLNSNNSIDLIVYQNQIDISVKVPACDIYILTSPMNAEALISQNEIELSETTFIAIGDPTSQTLKQLGAKNIHTSSEPSEEALSALLNQLI